MHESDRAGHPSVHTAHAGDPAAVSRARSGDQEAFRSLVERHSRYVFNVAYRLTGSASDAEDVVQLAFLKAYQQLSRFEARADFRTWLHRITVNCSIDLSRRPRSGGSGGRKFGRR
jgi:RNA polymerase sigma-70 factor (ECF subfamily)